MEKLKKPLGLRYIQAEAKVCAYSGEGEDADGKKGLETATAPSDSNRTTPSFYENPGEHIAQGLDSPGTVSAMFLGAGVGAVKGAELGAAVGSVVAPGPGTLVGGAYGAAGGMFVGAGTTAGVAAAHNCVGCHVIQPLFGVDPNKGK